MRGSVYIISNAAMPGLLKVGYTTRAVDQRLAELATTGVPGKFKLEFFCEIESAPTLERRVHSALHKHHHNKEFFRCSLNDAVRAVKAQLLSGAFIVYDIGGPANGAYLTEAEQRQIEVQAALLAQQRKATEDRRANIASLEERLTSLAPAVETVTKKYCSLGKNEGLRTAAMFGLAITAPLHLGAGLLLFDKISPPPLEEGRAAARKLTSSERTTIDQFNALIAQLRALDAQKSDSHISDFLRGLLLGLGHIKPS